MELCCCGSEYGEKGGNENAQPDRKFTAVAFGQPAAGDLRHNVAVKVGAQNDALNFRAPCKSFTTRANKKIKNQKIFRI